MPRIDLQMHLDAPIDHVFEGLADHGNYERFRAIGTSELVREGEEERNGKGAVRRLARWGLTFDEEITAFERPHRLDYLIVEVNIPLEHEGGSIRLTRAADGGTDVSWVSTFKLTVPLLSPVLEPPTAALLERGFRQMLEDVEAEYDAAAALG